MQRGKPRGGGLEVPGGGGVVGIRGLVLGGKVGG